MEIFLIQELTSLGLEIGIRIGVLSVSFEDSTINGTYNYKVKDQNQNTTALKLFDEIELTPIEIDDSLVVNQFSGTFNSIY